jgi:acyl-CoA dehydrogenase
MPTDHATTSFTNVFVPSSAIFGPLNGGLAVAQAFLHENRIRQAASSLGAATFCIRESIAHARSRAPFGKPLALNQGIQFPLVELMTQAEMLRLLIRKTACEMDAMPHKEVEKRISHKVSMCNYWANRLCCQAADQAIQVRLFLPLSSPNLFSSFTSILLTKPLFIKVHGGIGYSRHKPFEHIYRHHRRYRITEGSEEVQMRKVAFSIFDLANLEKSSSKL